MHSWHRRRVPPRDHLGRIILRFSAEEEDKAHILVRFLAYLGKMAELVQGVRLRSIFLISETGRGFESHSCHKIFFFISSYRMIGLGCNLHRMLSVIPYLVVQIYFER